MPLVLELLEGALDELAVDHTVSNVVEDDTPGVAHAKVLICNK